MINQEGHATMFMTRLRKGALRKGWDTLLPLEQDHIGGAVEFEASKQS